MSRDPQDYNRKWLMKEDYAILAGIQRTHSAEEVAECLATVVSDPPTAWNIQVRFVLLDYAFAYYGSTSLAEFYKEQEAIETNDDLVPWHWEDKYDQNTDSVVYDLEDPEGSGQSWFEDEIRDNWADAVICCRDGWINSVVRESPLRLATAAIKTVEDRGAFAGAQGQTLEKITQYLILRELEKHGVPRERMLDAIIEQFVAEINNDVLVLIV